MPTTGYAANRNRTDGNVRKSLQGSIFIAESSVAMLSRTDLFDASTGELQVLPDGWDDLGWTSDNGLKVSRDVSVSNIAAFGAAQPIRADVKTDTRSVEVVALETKLRTLGLYLGFDTTSASNSQVSDEGGSVWFEKPETPPIRYYRILCLVTDQDDDGEYDYGYVWPKMAVTAWGDQTLANGDDPTTWDATLTSFYDSDAGTSEAFFMGGPGWKANYANAGFSADSSSS